MKGTAVQSCGPGDRKGLRTGGKSLMKKKKGGFFRGLLKAIGILLLAVIIFVAGFFGFLSITEFRPEDTEALKLEGSPDEGLIPAGETVRIISWNLGFGALGDNADFFMDGGTMVRPSDEKRVISNLEKLVNGTQTETPDIVFLQEIDRDSRRSYHIDQLTYFRSALQGYTSTFATNFKVAFLPYPVPPIGKVDSGIAVFSRYAIDSAERVKLLLPSPGGEDFAYYEQHKPGLLFGLGMRNEAKGACHPAHTKDWDIDEDGLETGVKVFVQFVLDHMNQGNVKKQD